MPSCLLRCRHISAPTLRSGTSQRHLFLVLLKLTRQWLHILSWPMQAQQNSTSFLHQHFGHCTALDKAVSYVQGLATGIFPRQSLMSDDIR